MSCVIKFIIFLKTIEESRDMKIKININSALR